jgi:hypothetical protein
VPVLARKIEPLLQTAYQTGPSVSRLTQAECTGVHQGTSMPFRTDIDF